MVTKNKYLEVLEKYKMNPGDLSTKSRTWFNGEVRDLERFIGVNQNILKDSTFTPVKSIKFGSMYFYKYNPIGADTLDHYDMYPLVMPFNATATHFHALNFHYLHPFHRAKLLGEIVNISGDKSLTASSKTKFTWNMINAVANHKLTKHCVKQYIYKQIRSPIKTMNPEYWTSIVMLPAESFIGENKKNVWSQI